MARYKGFDGRDDTPFEVIREVSGQEVRGATIVSMPPAGAHPVVNLYVTAEGKLRVEADFPDGD